MKKLMASVALISVLGVTSVYANGSEPVFWDTAAKQYYYKDKNTKVYLPTGVNGKDGAPGAQGPQGNPGKDGVNGTNGVDGKDGVNGLNGRDVDYSRYQNDMAAVAGLGGLELRQGGAGVFSWSAGVGVVSSGGNSAESIAIGLHYGVADNWGVYGKVSKSLSGDSTAAFIGVEGQF